MPLTTEVRLDGDEQWRPISCLIPGDPPASVSDFSIRSGRQLYVLSCSIDDARTVVYRTTKGVDVDMGPQRLINTDLLVEHAVIDDGAMLEMTIYMDRVITPVQVRFRHNKVNFGVRPCRICNQMVPANELGRHAVAEHGPSPEYQWPGGPLAWLEELRKSLLFSIEAADGFPRLIEPLRWSLDQITDMQRTLTTPYN